MRRIYKALGLGLIFIAVSAQAQVPQGPVDTTRPWGRGMREPRQAMTPAERQQRVEQLRLQVEERFGRMVQQELQLNDQQMERVRQAMRSNQDRRRDLMRREVDLRRAMQAQLQPGVAANQDSLSRMLDAMSRVNVERAQSDQQYLRDLQFLTAVQRTRLLMMQRRLEERVREVRERQRGQPGPMGPGMGPRTGPGPGAGPGLPARPIEDEEDELAFLIEP